MMRLEDLGRIRKEISSPCKTPMRNSIEGVLNRMGLIAKKEPSTVVTERGIAKATKAMPNSEAKACSMKFPAAPESTYAES